ncbi:MAG TPA: hypothetical protein PLR32_01930 [candidate division Zixibacteria bacterium]|nr:hypothetical protein [candidate division Zixibacteria bacterium]MDD4918189.1 hypothetical protein [candidate division Zixibacteria bacterium]MDM7973693.1 hypothetical protein [candidate division Zixibacteria bacterium]HOD66554.1 hypothetical protein [candidate division Zixibacteria bacterium]HPI32045.1 hypothetical protein [candidate division Zixibacteria bacterium]
MSKPLFVVLGLLAAAPAAAQEPVYPAGAGVASTYTLSDTVLALGDTLAVTRTLVNGGSSPLAGLYFSENLPPDFTVVGESATVNGIPVAVLREGPLAGEVIPGYAAYRWIIDSPDRAVTRTLSPGDRAELTYRIVSSDIGRFPLPLHDAAGCGDSDGVFAVSSGDTVEILLSLGVDDDPGYLLPANALQTIAFPNPFNAEVSIAFHNAVAGGGALQFDVYDILGRRVDRQVIRPEGSEGIVRWEPDPSVGSGVFLYRLTDARHTAAGKVLLLK